jgi:hypothetical protein
MATGDVHASRLNDWLAARFTKEEIFYDRGSLQPGEDWRSRLRQEIESAVAVLAIVDSSWFASFGERSDSEDVVRFELETAIARKKTIMPLLAGGYRPDLKEAGKQLPESLQPILGRHFHVLDDVTPAAYETSIATLIAAIEQLEGHLATVEDRVCDLLKDKDYVAAERLLVQQSSSARRHASLTVYLALARLAGRSFNALYPAERETIERLLRQARKETPDSILPKLLLAIFEIDYCELNGVQSDAPVLASDVLHAHPFDDRWRALLSNLNVSRRARRELGLDTLLSGGTP